MKGGTQYSWFVPAIVLLGLALRAFLSFGLTSDQAFLSTDGIDYRDIGENLASGRGFSVSFYRWFESVPPGAPGLHADVHRPPLLSLVGAVLAKLPVGWMALARFTAVLIGTLVVFVTYRIARLICPVWPARAAGLAAAVYPYNVYWSARWSTEMLFLLLILSSAYFVISALQEGSVRRSMLGGIASGLAALARPNGLPIGVGFVLCFLWNRTAGWPKRVGGYLLCLIAIVTPYVVRNYEQTGMVTPVTAFGPYNFWLGNNERMYEMYRAFDKPSFPILLRALYDQDSKAIVRDMEAQGTFAVRDENRRWTQEAVAFMRQRPGHAGFIWVARILHYWRPWPNLATTGHMAAALSFLVVTPLYVLGLLGSITLWGRRELRPLMIPPFVGMLTAIPFVLHIRLRYPMVDMFMLMLGAVFVYEQIRLRRRFKRGVETAIRSR